MSSFYSNNHTLLGFFLVTLLSGCSQKPVNQIAQKIDQNMVLVKGGEYMMGSDSPDASDTEKPAHKVKIDSFYISKFEVTQELFEEVLGNSYSYFPGPNNPVNNISWQQANYFIENLNKLTGEHYRMPTEAEWEYAAIGGQKSEGYTYSGSNSIDDVAWYAENSRGEAHPVGMKEPNELGLYDMTGNVGEFVIDAYDIEYYQNSPVDNPNNAEDTDIGLAHKSVRGSSFSYPASESENYRRDFASQSAIMSDMGIRLVKDTD